MKQFVLDHLIRTCETMPRVRSWNTSVADADLTIELENHQRIAVYVINRAIRVPEIRERYETNTRLKLHTLFLIDGRMLPDTSIDDEPPFWMSALQAVSHGRLYTYWCEKRDVMILPAHIEWKWRGSSRNIEYGPAVDLGTLKTSTVQCASKYLDGKFYTVDFGEGTFWKKRQPNDSKHYSYSWRNWTYSSSQSYQHTQSSDDDGWDSWEDFQEAYEDSADFEFFEQFSSRRRQQQQRPPRSTQGTGTQQYYVMLGVGTSATLDDLKRAYRTKAREFHPDLHPDEKEKYTAKMAEINEAFEVLSKRVK